MINDYTAGQIFTNSKATHTTVTVFGTLHGTFWWPTGEPWEKYVHEVRTYRPGANTYTYQSETVGLRELILEITNDGDSQGAAMLSADSVVIVTRIKGNRKYVRTFPITMFGSVADMVQEDGQ